MTIDLANDSNKISSSTESTSVIIHSSIVHTTSKSGDFNLILHAFLKSLTIGEGGRIGSVCRDGRHELPTREVTAVDTGRFPESLHFPVLLLESCRARPASAARTAETTSKWKNGVSSRSIGASSAESGESAPPLRNSSATAMPSISAVFSPMFAVLRTSPNDTTCAISVGVLDRDAPTPNPPAMRALRIHGESTVAKWNWNTVCEQVGRKHEWKNVHLLDGLPIGRLHCGYQ